MSSTQKSWHRATASVRPDRGIFAAAVTRALWYQVGVFLLAFLLMLALPARRGHSAGAAVV